MIKITTCLLLGLFCGLSSKAQTNPFTISHFHIPPSANGAVLAKMLPAKSSGSGYTLVSDTSGLFAITKGDELRLKRGRSLVGHTGTAFEIAVQSDENTVSFILVKDEFIRNKVVAHRGAWKDAGVPQNSLKSEKLAMEYGCEAAEFDVWLSADGIAVVSHDATIGGKKIEETSATELQKVPIGSDCYVPTLEEYLTGIRGQNKTRLFLEIKTSEKGQERCLELTRKTVEMVQRMKMQAWVDYISFNYGVLQEIRRLDPSAQTAYLWGDRSPSVVYKDGLTGLDYPYDHYKKNPDWIEEAHRLHLSVNSWTINRADHMRELLGLGVDYITTDEPLMLLRLLEDNKASNNQKASKKHMNIKPIINR